MHLYAVTMCSSPNSPSTAGKRFDLVGTLVTRIFLHGNPSFASSGAADGGNRKKTAPQGRASISSDLESIQDRWGGAPECLNLAWGSCTDGFSAWRKSSSGGCSSHGSKEVEVRTGLRLDQHGSPASVHPLAGYGQLGPPLCGRTFCMLTWLVKNPHLGCVVLRGEFGVFSAYAPVFRPGCFDHAATSFRRTPSPRRASQMA